MKADELAGLTTAVAHERLAADGRNEVPSRERRSWRHLIGELIREPMLLLLLSATVLYALFGDTAEAIALGASVFVIIAITLVQQQRTERALEALRELASPRARVRRDGAWVELDARELVVGDVIQLGEGERVPADALLRSGTPLTVDESLLTGESVTVIRMPGSGAETVASVFAGTLVTSGNAIAEIVATGPRTQLGKIGVALSSIELARPPLHREVLHVVRRIAAVAFVLCFLLVGVHLLAEHGWLTAVLAGITLAMALMPEELPLVLTVFLTLGARRMTRHHVVARRAAAIETLGAMTVLCVDKTGTLTVNRMAIVRVATDVVDEIAPGARSIPESAHAVIEFGLLACPRHSIDAMDRAFQRLAGDALQTTEHVHPAWEWVHEHPLSPELLAVTHVWRQDDQRTVIATKGAPEAIVDLCHLDVTAAAQWLDRARAMAADGLRVLGVARGTHEGTTLPTNPHDYTFELVGLVGLVDPLREETAATVATCRAAGVRVVMITGDHRETAVAIAHAAGLSADAAITGPELEALGDEALAARLQHVGVIARATPAHKLRIVRALRAAGEVVGMTGDGVNDAPALAAADVGIAMGRGTDVAREAAGLVILDDSLSAITHAVRIGRAIYDNLRSVAAYLVSVHIPIAGLALVPPLVGWPLLLAPIHVVLLELVIDPTCSIVFELEPPAAGVMRRPPRGRDEHLFGSRRVVGAVVMGIVALAGPLATVAYAQATAMADGETRALAFIALLAADLALVIATLGHFQLRERNIGVRWLVPIVMGVAVAILGIPGLRTLFAFAPVALVDVALGIAAGAVPVLVAQFVRDFLVRRWQRACSTRTHVDDPSHRLAPRRERDVARAR